MSVKNHEKLEMKLLLSAINKLYGYDFFHYSEASLKRRVKNFILKNDLNYISEIIPKVIYNKDFFQAFLYNISVTVTEMFRDPHIYKIIREDILSELDKSPFIKIWHAGCATGEEAYSLAILLKEEGLYNKCHIYATDFNDISLEKAKEGIFPLNAIKKYSENYRLSDCKYSLSDYYYAEYGSAIISQELKSNITFANHNLVTDAVFAEINFIICRNVLIYFDRRLQNRVLNLFCDSLVNNGFLWIGNKESIQFADSAKLLKVVSKKHRIYQKTI